jgi:hypothetical protein
MVSQLSLEAVVKQASICCYQSRWVFHIDLSQAALQLPSSSSSSSSWLLLTAASGT